MGVKDQVGVAAAWFVAVETAAPVEQTSHERRR